MNDNVPIRDFIFPLIKARTLDEEFEYEELIGTGFLIGNRGFAITAAHVVEQLMEGDRNLENIQAIFADDTKWFGYSIECYEKHETEDVAIIKLKNFKRDSFLKVLCDKQHAAIEYHCWGYPRDVAKELQKLDENAMERPDLIFTQGYIRRRISGPLYPTILFRGVEFYELSETVGQGNSGGPIILKSPPYGKVIGLYIGEKEQGNIGYAVRAEAFANWSPKILEKTIIEECG